MADTVLDELNRRGLVSNCYDYDGLNKLLSKEKVICYIGFDCTAPSLHVGHLLPLMVARRLFDAGHMAVILLGEATTLIGDPTGRDRMREPMDQEQIRKNLCSIGNGLAFAPFVVVNNMAWFHEANYMALIMEYGRHFSVKDMLDMDSIKKRLESRKHLNFLELNYCVIQAIDFIGMNKSRSCKLQIGGEDQWDNILCGINLGNKLGLKLHGLTTPLLTKKDGTKMGKTKSGTVWLNEDMTSNYDYFQYFRNVDDASVSQWFNYFTFSDFDDTAPINVEKERLAYEATAIVRGEKSANEARALAREKFGLPPVV